MKRSISFLLLGVVLLLLVIGCTTPTPATTVLSSTKAKPIATTLTQTPIRTSTQPPSPTITTTPITPSPANTFAPTPDTLHRYQSISVLPEIPPGKNTTGTIVIGCIGGQDFDLDLATGSQRSFDSETNLGYVAPNTKWFADEGTLFIKEPEKREIVVKTITGQPLERILWGKQWEFYLAGWLDNDRLLIHQKKGAFWSTLTLNPFTGESEEIVPDYPLFYSCAGDEYGDIFACRPQTLDTSLRLAIYLRQAKPDEDWPYYVSLWDRQDNQELAKIGELYYHPAYNLTNKPLWASSGEFFVVATTVRYDENERSLTDDEQVMEWFYVSREGDVHQLTHFGDFYTDARFGEASLSPDGRRLAFWVVDRPNLISIPNPALHPNDNVLVEEHLAILDIETLTVTEYGIPGSANDDVSRPLWSPDSRYVVTENRYGPANANSYVILIDIQDGWAANVTYDGFPVAWIK